VPRTRIQEQGTQRPGRAQHRDNKEHEDGARREDVALVVPAHEPRKHAERGDQRDDLHDPPEDEGEAGDGHNGGGTLSGLVVEGERERICAGCGVTAQEKGRGAGQAGAAFNKSWPGGCRRLESCSSDQEQGQGRRAGVQRDSGLVVAKMSDVDRANHRVRGGW
jgi:hypothetical protein